jgi:flagellar motor switch protein FliG
MGVYTRFKRNPDGFRSLVELLETTPSSRRQRMIEVGMAEDPAYTEMALQFMMTFEDIKGLPDLELAELLAKASARMIAYSLLNASEEVVARFLRNSQPPVAAEIRDFMGIKIGNREAGGAQLKLVETARQLERQGLVRTKKIPIRQPSNG